ncbi:MAG: PQQ-binding-like beta-propeller repeat protein [Phycisphaerae bacterium]
MIHRDFCGVPCLAVILSIFVADVSHAAEAWEQWGGPSRTFAIPDWGTVTHPEPVWQQVIGHGQAGVLVHDNTIYTMVAGAPTETGFEEAVIALDRASGKIKWRYSTVDAMYQKQETFSGDGVSPKATPALIAGNVITVGFGGALNALRASDGKPQWSHHLVRDFKVSPVQFGFSASPLVWDEKLFVLAGGTNAGLLRLDPVDGRVIWRCPIAGEASYATPVIHDLGGRKSIVALTRDEIVGVDPENGEPLWRHGIASPGLTNVPTPLPLPNGYLLVSGQGMGGTRLMRISKTNGKFEATTQWHNDKAKFFCCNWIREDKVVMGSDGSLMLVLDWKTGELVDRQRGFKDANILRIGDDFWILGGEGDLSRLRLHRSESGEPKLTLDWHKKILDARCWTVPSAHNGMIFIRGDDKLIAMKVSRSDAHNGAAGGNATDSNPNDANKHVDAEKAGWPEPPVLQKDADTYAYTLIDQIVAMYHAEGAESSLGYYEELRGTSPKALTPSARIELASLALEQGMTPLAHMILGHGVEDYPESMAMRTKFHEVKAIMAKEMEKQQKEQAKQPKLPGGVE